MLLLNSETGLCRNVNEVCIRVVYVETEDVFTCQPIQQMSDPAHR